MRLLFPIFCTILLFSACKKLKTTEKTIKKVVKKTVQQEPVQKERDTTEMIYFEGGTIEIGSDTGAANELPSTVDSMLPRIGEVPIDSIAPGSLQSSLAHPRNLSLSQWTEPVTSTNTTDTTTPPLPPGRLTSKKSQGRRSNAHSSSLLRGKVNPIVM